KGDPLFKVNSEMAKRSLEKANAEVKKAEGVRDVYKEQVDYVKKLEDLKHPAPTEKEVEAKRGYAAAVAGLEEAQSAQKQAQLAMDWTTVRAPISGVIIERNLYIGQPVGLSATVSGGSSGSGSSGSQIGPGGGAPTGGSTSSMFGMTELRVPYIIASDLGEME